jgi:hypothetical protein
MFLFHQATEDDPTTLDDAITALEGLTAQSEIWFRAYMDCFERRQRIRIREEPKPILDGPIRVNDTDDPAIQAVLGA